MELYHYLERFFFLTWNSFFLEALYTSARRKTAQMSTHTHCVRLTVQQGSVYSEQTFNTVWYRWPSQKLRKTPEHHLFKFQCLQVLDPLTFVFIISNTGSRQIRLVIQLEQKRLNALHSCLVNLTRECTAFWFSLLLHLCSHVSGGLPETAKLKQETKTKSKRSADASMK